MVADNCSDDTASLAAQSGAEVIERQDAERRGKGYALAYGLDHLAKRPPDVVIIVDADCLVSEGSLGLLARQAQQHSRPVQADYVLTPPQRPQGLAVVSALAFLVKNRVRPRGLAALGLPCALTGTGMAFTWDVIRKAPPTDDNLVEDMVMGLALARLGHAPMLCPEARVRAAPRPHTGAIASASAGSRSFGSLPSRTQAVAQGSCRQGGSYRARWTLLVPPLSLRSLRSRAREPASGLLGAHSRAAVIASSLAR